MDTVVIGAGLSGLVAAIRLARAGQRVTLLTKGIGGLQLSQGTVDVLGYTPERVERPYEAIASYAKPAHPYAVIGAAAVRTGVDYVAELVGPDLLVGDGERNVLLPTAVGAIRPTCLVQPSMVAGEVVAGKRYAIVGFRHHKDFYSSLCAANLVRSAEASGISVTARGLTLDLTARADDVDSSALAYARAFDDPSYRQRFATLLKPKLEAGEVVGVPAVLGIKQVQAWRDVAERLGHEIFEIPVPPPGVPGMRLNEKLTAVAKAAGVRVVLGSIVVGAATSGGRVQSVSLASAGRNRDYAATSFVYAPGGFESGALTMNSYGTIAERVFNLPLAGVRDDLVTGDYWSDQALFEVGVAVDENMRPLDPAGRAVYENLHCAGGILAGATRWSEKSGEGIALGSAVRAADAIRRA
jgi:glycerol-3-phosphate dehydrogenase subunit B